MSINSFQKGKFYTLPLKDKRKEGNNWFFIVEANSKEYAIRMFDFQKNDPGVMELTELPCMVKDVHGDNIVFVQNFALMFSERYVTGKKYPFIVTKEVYNPILEFRYYDVRDENGIPFRLKCDSDVYLVPNQKIKCLISRPNKNKMVLSYASHKKESGPAASCFGLFELLDKVDVDIRIKKVVNSIFDKADVFAEARQYYNSGDPEWVIKAVNTVPDAHEWTGIRFLLMEQLLHCFHRLCLYLLEDSDYLLQFSESDRENFQEWIAAKVQSADINLEILALINQGKDGQEIDTILRKIQNSGYIYHPDKRMRNLIAMFKLQPELLEEKIDSILDLVARCARDWRQPEFNSAFTMFLRFFIMSNRGKVNRLAVVDDERGRILVRRMVRSISFLLLMTNGADPDSQLYKAMLCHYLSYGRSKTQLTTGNAKMSLSEQLVDLAFDKLMQSGDTHFDFTWNEDFTNSEIFAYKIMKAEQSDSTLLTRSYEAGNIRFTASGEGLSLSRTTSSYKDKNVLPQGFPGWHNIKIFLDQPVKTTVNNQTKKLSSWKSYWQNVEQSLFEKREVPQKVRIHKRKPDVGTETYIRILDRDFDYPCRFYCRIEDPLYEGEGWIDAYQKGGSIGLFHFDPCLDIDSFYVDGKPMLLKARVNSVGSPKDEVPTYTFDCISYIDDFIKDQVDCGSEADCTVFYKDTKNNVLCCVTEFGYGIFVPITYELSHLGVGDSFAVSVTDNSRPNAIQGEYIGSAEYAVNVGEATSKLMKLYAGDDLYEETAEELEEEAMSISEDSFDSEYIKEIINIIDHKAILENDNVKAFAYLSIAHILARMMDDAITMKYLEQRANFLCLIQDFGANGKLDDDQLLRIDEQSADMVEKFPLLKMRLTEMRIVNCFGQPDRNAYLWQICNEYSHDHTLAKLSRLLLSYNMMDGFGLQEQQLSIVAKIKGILNVNVELPKIYSFGEEDQVTEFKTSIVYPPDNNMKPDLKTQTFNIMKVICGMLNSYGGTLYLGVNDTGTARGLADDVAFMGGTTDKYDLYVRNQIRNAFGDQVNALINVDHPEAGKHYIYAIRIPSSKTPVALRTDNTYYLREGSSTYAISLDQLEAIMKDRDYARTSTQSVDLEELPASDAKASDTSTYDAPADMPKMRLKSNASDSGIATSALRTNVVNNWEDGYGVDTIRYMRIQSVGNWCVLDDVPYEDGLLTMAIQEQEKDGSIVIVYENGKVVKSPISQIIDKAENHPYKMYQLKKPIFCSPAKKTDALLTAYEDDKGKQYLRLDDLAFLPDGKMMSAGDTLTDQEFKKVIFCEIVDQEFHLALKRLHNQKRTTLGMQALTSYGLPEQAVLKNLGIEF